MSIGSEGIGFGRKVAIMKRMSYQHGGVCRAIFLLIIIDTVSIQPFCLLSQHTFKQEVGCIHAQSSMVEEYSVTLRTVGGTINDLDARLQDGIDCIDEIESAR